MMYIKREKERRRGFTLIELLVVIAIIGLLSSVVLASLNSARGKARDARRKADLVELSKAIELCYDGDCNGGYPDSVGAFDNLTQFGGTNTGFNIVAPKYIPTIPRPPGYINDYAYLRKDYTQSGCTIVPVDETVTKYGLYAKLENPTAQDMATMADSIDKCAQTSGYNFKAGN